MYNVVRGATAVVGGGVSTGQHRDGQPVVPAALRPRAASRRPEARPATAAW